MFLDGIKGPSTLTTMSTIAPEEEFEVTESFDDLNLSNNLLKGIYAYGFEDPTPI